jgi:predicted RNA-binding Zn ribbon-like protein
MDMGETEKYTRTLRLREGWLCLDFANTASWRASNQLTEHLRSYSDLVAWAHEKGLLTSEEQEHLLRRATLDPNAAEATLRQAIELRECIYRIFSAIANGRTVKQSDLDFINEALAEATTHFRVIADAEGFVWDWERGDVCDSMLWPVVRSAVNLLTSEDLGRVGECADERGCGWLFFDTSRNRSRRWCSMEECGNRAKARLHYKRQRLHEQM